ncbi:MAG: hypothetical protein HPY50_06595 [Firmicutes bacterium]|nr:hypothetical protein [Bacillota bacterium]
MKITVTKHFFNILSRKIWIIISLMLVGGCTVALAALKTAYPKVAVNALIGSFTGLLLGLGIIYLISLSDKTVFTVEDIENNSKKLKVIGIIPEHSIE